MKVLMITSEFPTAETPFAVPFISRQVDFLRKRGVKVSVFSFRGSKNPWRYLKTYFKVQSVLKKESFDLIHAQFGQSGVFTLFNSLPMVVTFRGSDLEGIIGPNGNYTFKGKILQWMSKWVARKSQAIVLVSESLAKHLPPGCAYQMIPSGLDLELFKPMDQLECRRRLNWKMDVPIILFGGRPGVKRKRFELAKEAIAKTASKPLLKPLDDVLPHEVPLMMNASDGLLLSSLHEGSPNVVKEALACNTPVISVDVGDVKERIQDIDGCYLCRNHSADEIARGVDFVLTTKSPSFTGRKHVEDLNEYLLTDKLIAIYNATLNKNGRG
ncbi:MAG: glycosyltransferase [Cyclobacteriaceae bacterium]|nr:glycosyltransferase [Cyclobacteriaceae bacterium]